MAWMLLVLVLAGPRVGGEIRIESELMELNHSYTCEGKHRFDQVIMWKWSPDYRRWNVRRWRIISNLSEYPEKNGSQHFCTVKQGDRNVVMQSRLYRETWTIGDPERENALLFPVELR